MATIRWPIGTDAEDVADGEKLPGVWVNSNPYLNYYEINVGVWNYHDGVDLNLNIPTWNADWHKPIRAIMDGAVVYAGVGGGSWGHIVDIRHDLANGTYVVSRFGHVESTLVKTGDKVTCGQQVASVGNADGWYGTTGAHLHWNISAPDDPIMINTPNEWCGANRQCVLDHYIDPIAFVVGKKKVGTMPPTAILQYYQVNTPNSSLLIRQGPGKTYTSVGSYIDKSVVLVDTTTLSNGYVETPDDMWTAEAYLLPVDVQDVTITAALNVRAGPSLTAAIMNNRFNGPIPKGTVEKVLTTEAAPGWLQLVRLGSGNTIVGYIKAEFTSLGTSSGPVASPSPTSTAKTQHGVNLLGLHIEAATPFDWSQAIGMATRLKAAGKPLAACVVIDSVPLANILVPLVNYVIFRSVASGNQFQGTALTSVEAAKAHAGYIWGLHQGFIAGLDPRIYIQTHNETGYQALDYAYEQEIIRLAESQRRKAAIYGDSYGTPQVAEWQTRIPALADAVRGGHLLCLHEYGATDGAPVDAVESQQWFSLRHRMAYATLPAYAQPTLVIGETGRATGTPIPVADWQAYNALLEADSYVGGFCTWGVGRTDPKYDMNSELPALEQMITTL